jgi:hypothetical protein
MTCSDAPTHRSRGAPTVAVVLCAVAVCVPVTGCGSDVDNDGAAAAVAPPAAQAADTPVQDFIEFAGAVDSRRQGSNDADPQYIVEGLRKLAGALGTLHVGSPDLQVDLRVVAEHLLLSPTSTATTMVVRNALIAAAEAIQARQHGEHGDLRQLAASLSVEAGVLDQQAMVSAFFHQAAAAIEGPPISAGPPRPRSVMNRPE